MKRLFTALLLGSTSALASAATNLVANGTFDENVSGWDTYNGATGCVTVGSDAHSGSGCLKVVADADNVAADSPWKTQIHTDFISNPLPAGNYTLSFYVKANKAAKMRCSAAGDEAYQPDVDVTTEYKKVTWDMTSKGELSGFNFDLGYAEATFFIDDVVLTSNSEMPLIPNGAFDEGTSNWGIYNGADDCLAWCDKNGQSGSGCMKVVNAESNPSDQWKTQIHTNFSQAALPKGEYTLTYYIKCESGKGSCRVSIGTHYQPDQDVTTEYKKVTYDFTADGEEDGLNFDLAAVANTYYIDNVELICTKLDETVPEEEEIDQSEYTSVSVAVNSDKFQKVFGIGGGIVYYQSWFEAHPNKAAVYDTIFTGLGLSGLRIANWAQDLDPTTETLAHDKQIYNEAKKRLGNDFFVEMSSWSAPKSLKANNSINGTNGGSVKASLKQKNGAFVYDEFGEWWRKSLEIYHSMGIYPDYISIQNEPDMDAQYEATLFNPSEGNGIASYGKALSAVYKSLNGMEHRPKIIGPEPLGVGWNNTQKYIDAADTDKSQLDGYCFHFYHSGVQTHSEANRYYYPDDFLPAMKGIADAYYGNKPLIMTENCSMHDNETRDAVYLAWLMANSFNANRLNSYLYWNLLWGQDKAGCIMVENPWESDKWKTKEGFRVFSDYHGLRHFSKFVRPGMTCLGVTSSNSDVVTAAFIDSLQKTYAIVIINTGSNHDVDVNVPSVDADGNEITYTASLVRTSPALDEWSSVVDYRVGDAVKMPAKSVATLVLNANSSLSSAVPVESVKNWISMADGNLNVNANADGVIKVRVLDVLGSELYNGKLAVKVGANAIALPSLPKGVLLVETEISGNVRVDKVLNR